MIASTSTSKLDINSLIDFRDSETSNALTILNPDLVAKAKLELKTIQFPTTRQEQWKYTRTGRIASEKWNVLKSQDNIDISRFSIPDLDADRIVFVNGFLNEELSVFSGDGWNTRTFDSIAGKKNTSIESDGTNKGSLVDIFSVLALTHNTDGLVLNVQKDADVVKPIHILFIQTGENVFACPWLDVALAENAKATIILSHHSIGEKKHWLNATLNVNVEKDAKFSYYKIQDDSEQGFSVFMENIVQSDNSHSNTVTCTLKGGWIRNNLSIAIEGSHCEANLSACYAPQKREHLDHHTVVDHIKPHSVSNELYKGVVFDQGRSVFNGKVFVRFQAQKTNAFQTNANLMMSDDAIINSKPELEIYADDVKCSHGSTTGQLDEEALFYLRSRGLSDDDARRLLVSAFFNDVLEKIDKTPLKEYVIERMIANGVMLA